MSFCPENVENWSLSPQNLSKFSPAPTFIWGCFPLSPGTQIQEIAVRSFSILLGRTRSKCPIGSEKNVFFDPIPDSKIIFTSLGSKKGRRRFIATRPLEKPETPPYRSWRELRHILRRERPIFKISGSKAHHANVLKGTFSTDCESDGIRIGLTANETNRNEK